jgi:hypothetical protein
MITATKQVSIDIQELIIGCDINLTSAEIGFSPLSKAGCLNVTERVRVTTKDVHPGWVRATSILLKGMERLRLQELAESAQNNKKALSSNPADLSFSQ